MQYKVIPQDNIRLLGIEPRPLLSRPRAYPVHELKLMFFERKATCGTKVLWYRV